MRILITALALSATFTTAVNAQSAADGAYAGASFARFSGENTYDNSGGPLGFALEGQMLGAFAGYNSTYNGFVVGGEIAFMSGAAFEEGFEDQYEFTSIIDLKARAGYDAGQFMPYAVIGLARGNFSIDDSGNPALNEDISESGFLFGVGVDIAASPQVTIGVEYVRRSFDFEFESGLVDMSAEVNSFGLRGAYKF